MVDQLKAVHAEWDAPENVVAFSTTRNGGFSQGEYDSFNLGTHVGDQLKTVLKNRELLKSHYTLPTEPVWLEQTHSTDILELDSTDFGKPSADSSITSSANIVCAVMTADCLPLFLCDNAGAKVGVVHAGWLGMASGVIENTVDIMNTPVEELIAWAGPCISKKHFEIGDEVRQQLGGSAAYYSASENDGKYFADLYGLAGERLSKMGVHKYSYSDACTFADQDHFFSHRRDKVTGRMVSIIYLT